MYCSCVQASDHLGELFESKGAERAEVEAPHLSQLFHVGQMVRCTVTEVGRGNERIGMQAAQQMQARHSGWPCKAPLHAGLQLSRGLCRWIAHQAHGMRMCHALTHLDSGATACIQAWVEQPGGSASWMG